MENNKSPGNDDLSKEFYCLFRDETKNIFINSLRESKYLKALSTYQRQAVIRLIEKLNKGKRFISNWRFISLLNVVQKLVSKTLAAKLKKSSSVFNWSWSDCIHQWQVLRRNLLFGKLEGYLLAIDFEKAFDSLNHSFLIATLEHYGFGNDFTEWIKILPKNQESCVINGGHTPKYLRLTRGARQGDSISDYVFILTS